MTRKRGGKRSQSKKSKVRKPKKKKIVHVDGTGTGITKLEVRQGIIIDEAHTWNKVNDK